MIKIKDNTSVLYSVTGLVLGVTWGGGEGTYPLQEEKDVTNLNALMLGLEIKLIRNGLTGTGDFNKQLGAIVVITKTTTIRINGKPFVNTDVRREVLGTLSAKQTKLLNKVLGW